MSKILLSVLFIFCLGLTSAVFAQNAQSKTGELIAALAKTKYKKKEKKNIRLKFMLTSKAKPLSKTMSENIRAFMKLNRMTTILSCAFQVTARLKETVMTAGLIIPRNKTLRSKMHGSKARY
jgi:hypothetical protein